MRLTAAGLADRRASPPAPLLDFEALFSGLETATGIVAAVSGGPDSTALLHGLARWCEGGGRPPIVVATLDHGLRPGSANEATAVAAAASAAGLPYRVLTWEGAKLRTRVQERARQERYRQLAALARDVGASHVTTGHTLDDQAETVIMRLVAGTGIAGLSGMRPHTVWDGVTLARPFLGVRKARLVELCHAEGWAYLHDPSNFDLRYGRSRLRARIMPALAGEGLTPERLGALAQRARRDCDALETRAAIVLAAVRLEPPDASHVILDGARLKAEPDAILLRVMERAIAAAAGALTRSVRLETLEGRILGDLRSALDQNLACRTNLGGVLIDLRPDGRMVLTPEPPRRDPPG